MNSIAHGSETSAAIARLRTGRARQDAGRFHKGRGTACDFAALLAQQTAKAASRHPTPQLPQLAGSGVRKGWTAWACFANVPGPKRTVSCPEYCFAVFLKAALQRLPEQNNGDQP